MIGIQPEIEFKPQGILASVPQSFLIVGTVFIGVGRFFQKLFGAGLDPGDLGGPVLIAKMARDSAQSGWAAFFFFIAALSVNLAILNLLPLPMLDGGHLLFLVIEWIRGKPLSINTRTTALKIGLFIILLLMAYVTINDLFLIFGG